MSTHCQTIESHTHRPALDGRGQEIYETCVPAAHAALAGTRAALGAALGRQSWNAGESARVLTATTEALVNAVEHGSQRGAEVRVSWLVEPGRAWIAVTDEGRPDKPYPTGPACAPSERATCGRGRLMMHALAERVASRAVGGGTRVSLEFRAAG